MFGNLKKFKQLLIYFDGNWANDLMEKKTDMKKTQLSKQYIEISLLRI